MKFFLKYRLFIITLLVIIWSLITDSRFEKGGVSQEMDIAIIVFIFINLLIYLIPSLEIIWPEKLIFSFVLTALSLFISTVFLMDKILERILGIDYEIKLWDFWPAFGANLIYCVVNLLPCILLLMMYEQYRNKKIN